MDSRLTDVGRKLKTLMTDPVVVCRPVLANTRDINESTIKRSGDIFCSAGHREEDLEFISKETGDPSWTSLKDRWCNAPLDLQWLCIASKDRTWLAYKSLYLKAPADLRYIAVHTLDPRWLHNTTTWLKTPMEAKLHGILKNDPGIARPSRDETAFDAVVDSLEKRLPDWNGLRYNHHDAPSPSYPFVQRYLDEGMPLNAKLRFKVEDIRYSTHTKPTLQKSDAKEQNDILSAKTREEPAYSGLVPPKKVFNAEEFTNKNVSPKLLSKGITHDDDHRVKIATVEPVSSTKVTNALLNKKDVAKKVFLQPVSTVKETKLTPVKSLGTLDVKGASDGGKSLEVKAVPGFHSPLQKAKSTTPTMLEEREVPGYQRSKEMIKHDAKKDALHSVPFKKKSPLTPPPFASIASHATERSEEVSSQKNTSKMPGSTMSAALSDFFSVKQRQLANETPHHSPNSSLHHSLSHSLSNDDLATSKTRTQAHTTTTPGSTSQGVIKKPVISVKPLIMNKPSGLPKRLEFPDTSLGLAKQSESSAKPSGLLKQSEGTATPLGSPKLSTSGTKSSNLTKQAKSPIKSSSLAKPVESPTKSSSLGKSSATPVKPPESSKLSKSAIKPSVLAKESEFSIKPPGVKKTPGSPIKATMLPKPLELQIKTSKATLQSSDSETSSNQSKSLELPKSLGSSKMLALLKGTKPKDQVSSSTESGEFIQKSSELTRQRLLTRSKPSELKKTLRQMQSTVLTTKASHSPSDSPVSSSRHVSLAKNGKKSVDQLPHGSAAPKSRKTGSFMEYARSMTSLFKMKPIHEKTVSDSSASSDTLPLNRTRSSTKSALGAKRIKSLPRPVSPPSQPIAPLKSTPPTSKLKSSLHMSDDSSTDSLSLSQKPSPTVNTSHASVLQLFPSSSSDTVSKSDDDKKTARPTVLQPLKEPQNVIHTPGHDSNPSPSHSTKKMTSTFFDEASKRSSQALPTASATSIDTKQEPVAGKMGKESPEKKVPLPKMPAKLPLLKKIVQPQKEEQSHMKPNECSSLGDETTTALPGQTIESMENHGHTKASALPQMKLKAPAKKMVLNLPTPPSVKKE